MGRIRARDRSSGSRFSTQAYQGYGQSPRIRVGLSLAFSLPPVDFYAAHPILRQVAPAQRLVLRASADPVSLLPGLQQAAQSVDRDLALLDPVRLDEEIPNGEALLDL